MQLTNTTLRLPAGARVVFTEEEVNSITGEVNLARGTHGTVVRDANCLQLDPEVLIQWDGRTRPTYTKRRAVRPWEFSKEVEGKSVGYWPVDGEWVARTATLARRFTSPEAAAQWYEEHKDSEPAEATALGENYDTCDDDCQDDGVLALAGEIKDAGWHSRIMTLAAIEGYNQAVEGEMLELFCAAWIDECRDFPLACAVLWLVRRGWNPTEIRYQAEPAESINARLREGRLSTDGDDYQHSTLS